MNAETATSNEEIRSQVLQDTLQQISSLGANGSTKCCVICLSDLTEPCEARPCRHDDFDYLCLVTWLESRATCPLCKSEVCEVQYDQHQDGKPGKVYRLPVQFRRRAEDGSSGSLPSGAQGISHASRSAQRRPWPYEDEAVRRRRLVYRHKLYSLHIGSNKRQPEHSRHKELSPQLFMTDPELVSRARTWIRRELCVFKFLYIADDNDNDVEVENFPQLGRDMVPRRRSRPKPCKAEFLLEYIIAILKTVDTQGSAGQAEDMIQDFLGRDNTQLFLHELRAWLRGPWKSLSEWDCVVQYSGGNILHHESQDTI